MRRRWMVAVTAALGVVLAACAKSGEPSSFETNGKTSGAMLLVADKTVAAKTAKIAMSIDLGAAAGRISGDGAFDFPGRRGFMSLSVPALAGTSSGSYEIRFIGDVLYVKIPLPGVPQGKPWFKVDVKAPGKTAGVDLSRLMQSGNQDPTSAIQFLRAAGDVKVLGSEKVRGESTTHYSAVIDVAKAIDQVPESARAQLQALLDKAHITTLPIEVWVDGAQRVRRMRYSLDASAFGGGTPAASGLQNVTLTIELFDFGSKVDVEAPPADQVSDFSELLKQYHPEPSSTSDPYGG